MDLWNSNMKKVIGIESKLDKLINYFMFLKFKRNYDGTFVNCYSSFYR